MTTPPEEHARLWISADRIRESVPWKLRFEGQEDALFDAGLEALTGKADFTLEEIEALPGQVAARLAELDLWEALTAEQIRGLAGRFQLPEGDLRRLSRDLAKALNTTLSPVQVAVPRQLAIDRASDAMRLATEDVMAASDRMVNSTCSDPATAACS